MSQHPGAWLNPRGRGPSGASPSRPRVAVGGFDGVACAELLPDGRRGACPAPVGRRAVLLAGLGAPVKRVMTDGGPGPARLSGALQSGRPHSTCGGLPPISRVPGINNLSAHNS